MLEAVGNRQKCGFPDCGVADSTIRPLKAGELYLDSVCANVARTEGSKRIADKALVAMILLIAESRPEEKAVLTGVVVSLIDRRNR